MKMGGVARSVKYYDLQMNDMELKLMYEMIVNEIEYINEEMMGYESAINRGMQLEQRHHQEIYRLKGNFFTLGIMERQLKEMMTKLNRDKMQEELK